MPMRFKWWFFIDDWFLNLPGSRTCADVAAQLYWVTCLLVNFSKENIVTQHMQGTWPMPRSCKCLVIIRGNILNARGSVRSPDIAARLYWVTCLLGHFSKEGTVMQHMQGTWPMPRYCKCWVVRENILNARGTVRSLDIATRLYWATCLLRHFSKKAPWRSICKVLGQCRDAVNVE